MKSLIARLTRLTTEARFAQYRQGYSFCIAHDDSFHFTLRVSIRVVDLKSHCVLRTHETNSRKLTGVLTLRKLTQNTRANCMWEYRFQPTAAAASAVNRSTDTPGVVQQQTSWMRWHKKLLIRNALLQSCLFAAMRESA